MSKTSKVLNKILPERRVVFAFPHVFLSVVFVLIPLIILVFHAFIDHETGAFTLENFASIFAGEDNSWKTIGRTFLVALATTGICLLLCYPLALALNRIKSGKTAILVSLFILPMWVNSLLRIIAVKFLLEQKIGLGGTLTIIGMVYDFMPFMLLPIYTSISNIDNSYIEASHDLGGSTLKTLLRVTLPLSVPGIVSGILMVFMPTVSTFAISERLGGGNFMLFGEAINMTLITNLELGSAFSLVLMALIAVSMLVASWLSKGKATAAAGGTFS